MNIMKIDVQDGRGIIEVAVADWFQEERLRSYLADADKALALYFYPPQEEKEAA